MKTYSCPYCAALVYFYTPHQCGPDSLAHARPARTGLAKRKAYCEEWRRLCTGLSPGQDASTDRIFATLT